MRLVTGGIAAALLVLLSGCAAPAPAATQTPVAEPTPVETVPATPLTCDELVSADLVAAAMTGADGVAPEPVPAIQASTALHTVELAAAGGLGCSWRVGAAPERHDDGSGDHSYLTVEVLPGAAVQWPPALFDDVPAERTLDVDGIAASKTFGEWGWALTGSVGDAWVAIRLVSPGLGATSTRYDGLARDEIFARLGAVAAPAFGAVAQASPEQLAWPAAETKRDGTASCSGGLDPMGISLALEQPSVEVELSDPTTSTPDSFGTASAAAAGSFSCVYLTGAPGDPVVTVVRGAGEQFESLLAADASTAFAPLDLSAVPGYAEGDLALRAVVTDGPASPVIMRVGDSVYEVRSSDGATSVAEAILAQIR